MNMLFFLPVGMCSCCVREKLSSKLRLLGETLERRYGSLQYLCLLLLLVLVPSLAICLIAAMFNVVGYFGVLRECSVGFSGVLFAFLAVQACETTATHQSVFGLFRLFLRVIMYESVAWNWAAEMCFELIVPCLTHRSVCPLVCIR